MIYNKAFTRQYPIALILVLCYHPFLLSGQCSLLKDINQGGGNGIEASYAGKLVTQGRMYFAADDGIHGAELWVTNGTASGTRIIKDINPGQAGSFPKFFFDLGTTIVFAADDGVHGIEWWRTDGTEAGTLLVKDIYSGNSLSIFGDSFKENETEQLDSIVIFNGGGKLWRTNGTEEGTYEVKALYGNYSSNPQAFVRFNDKVYFFARNGDLVFAVMVTDGTEAGTHAVDEDSYNQTYGLSPLDDGLYYLGKTAATGSQGLEPWFTDGTPEGTWKIKDINPDGGSLNYGGPQAFQRTNDWVLFTANDGTHGHALWRTDATALGTTMIKDFHPSTHSDYAPRYLHTFDDVVFFSVDDGVHGNEIWRSEGEIANTYLLKDINPGDSSSHTLFWRVWDHLGKMYFSADDGVHGIEVWESDGTSTGTQLTMDIHPDSSSFPDNFISLGNILLFTAYTPEFGYEFYRHDPTLEKFTVADTFSDLRCFESADGYIHLNITGGLPPYTIAWNDPNLSGAFPDSLSIGEYDVFIRDSFGYCTNRSFVLSEPEKLAYSKKATNATQQLSNGAIRLDVTGGTPPYSFAWSHADTLAASAATQLAAGDYTCTVTDDHGCLQIVTTTIKQINTLDEPPNPTGITINPNPVNDDVIVIRAATDFKPVTSYIIYNELGAVQQRGQLPQRNDFEIPIEQLAPGFYFIQLIQDHNHFWGQPFIRL